ncbi:patatin-like phospholipase family protein [Lichenihabitans psoromatis]|uniref:patatin-like phospholipase family protein n=1 Tax=Lichenihabitans psoromatis TaxID=2528642 RepID=UPI00103844D4|nr:patatin-like phospholipase family protein [Lichenihabitans psoromatis]
MVFPFGWSVTVRAQEDQASGTEAARPKVGLALGAGAARGWSQLGILRELLANGFAPDIVAGTSVGAVVGGCYCAGHLDELESFALSLNKRRVFGLMDFTLSGMGLLGGARLRAKLERDLGDVQVKDLPIHFASVATEVHTGHEIWLTQGRLVDAICASYALPGLFEPVHLDGRWLIDGALVNPIPVSVCRALGADIVIAVNLVAETLVRRPTLQAPAPTALARSPDTPALASDVPSGNSWRHGWWSTAGATGTNRPRTTVGPSAPGMASVLVDAFNITQDRIARSRLAGDPPDVIINVKVGKIGLFDFHRARELIDIGRDATQRAMPDLRDYVDLYPVAVATPPEP